MALILLTWMWDRVVANCNGGPEAIAYYQFHATVRVMQMGTCSTGQGNQTTPCKVVAAATPVFFGPRVLDPGTGTTVQTSFDPISDPSTLPLPPVGGFSAWPWPSSENPSPVVAVDYGGNASGEGVCR